jgi:nitroreductase
MPDTVSPPSPALTALLARASVPARLLREPGPDDAALDLAVAAALRAPDHGGLRPWRFVVVRGAMRTELGEVLAASLARREPGAPPERLDLERAKPLRAPMVIAAGVTLRHDHRIPVWEQEASAAAGTMNLLNALDAQGYGAIWLSSGALRDPEVKVALGLEATDALLGWIYVGTPAEERPTPARPDPRPFWRVLQRGPGPP